MSKLAQKAAENELKRLEADKEEQTKDQALLDDYQEFDLGGGIKIEYLPDKGIMRWRESGDLVDKDALWALAFLISKEEERDKLIPLKTQETRTFYKVKTLTLSRDCKKGTKIDVPFKFTVPLEMLVKATASGMYIPKK